MIYILIIEKDGIDPEYRMFDDKPDVLDEAEGVIDDLDSDVVYRIDTVGDFIFCEYRGDTKVSILEIDSNTPGFIKPFEHISELESILSEIPEESDLEGTLIREGNKYTIEFKVK